jgi:fido (protein-threonine AMPylation protein)
METNHQKTWEEIQEHGLVSTIQSWEDYVQEYQRNTSRAESFLLATPSLWGKEAIQKTHALLFQNIVPWAGEFSTRQEIIGGIPGSPPELRNQEFELLEKQLNLLEQNSESKIAKIRTAAFQHSRLLCIHPFRDGNGRACRALLAHQIQRITGTIRPLRSKKAEYISALQACHPAGNLGPLSNLLCQTYLGKPDPCKFLPVPFRINSMQLAVRPADQLEKSVREGPEVINLIKPPMKIRWLTRISWFEIEQLVGSEESNTLPKVREEWETHRLQSMTLEELQQFLASIENQKPYLQKTGLRKRGTSWSPVLKKLTEAYLEANNKREPSKETFEPPTH